MSPEGRGTKASPSPPDRRINEGVRGALEVVAVLPLVIKLGVEPPFPSHSLCESAPAFAISISWAFNRRNIGTAAAAFVPRPAPDRPTEDAGDACMRVLSLPCVIV